MQGGPCPPSITSLVGAKADVWILSSGVGLSPTRARQLHSAGLTGVILSLDHWDESRHDQFRGFPGAFRAVARAAAECRAAELVVGLSLCATRAFVSADNLERYADTARALGASFIQLLEPKAVGRYEEQDVALRPDQQKILEDFCDRLNQQDGYRDFPAVSYADYASRSTRCYGAGDRHLYIDTDGSIHACPFCRGTCGSALNGNFETSLAAVRQTACQLQSTR